MQVFYLFWQLKGERQEIIMGSPGRFVSLPARGSLAKLCFREYGEPNGFPVIFSHGNLNSRLYAPAWEKTEEVTKAANVRLIAVDRPGVGGSTPQPGRTYSSFAEDIEVLVDTLGLKRFGVAGFSSGGPHALAVACEERLGERVSSLSLISSDAPYKRIGPEMIKRLYGVENLTAEIALQNAQTNYDHLKTSYLGMTKENRRKLAIEDVEEAVKQGLEGVAADSLLETGDWDFEISNIKSPVTVWHGKADTDVPVESSRFLVDLFPQTCQKKINYIEGESHSMIRRHWNSILEDLVSASKL